MLYSCVDQRYNDYKIVHRTTSVDNRPVSTVQTTFWVLKMDIESFNKTKSGISLVAVIRSMYIISGC